MTSLVTLVLRLKLDHSGQLAMMVRVSAKRRRRAPQSPSNDGEV